jgi:hypothetical protein
VKVKQAMEDRCLVTARVAKRRRGQRQSLGSGNNSRTEDLEDASTKLHIIFPITRRVYIFSI